MSAELSGLSALQDIRKMMEKSSRLYAFTIVLVRLEDTALLIGSIGLFLVLALVMYGSRRIQWYGKPVPTA